LSAVCILVRPKSKKRMRIAFFSDVHSNLEALRAVLDDAKEQKVEKFYFLGDAVGYGPDPNECVKIVRDLSQICLYGNHDYAALGLMNISYFNPYAAEAIRWTQRNLSTESRELFRDFKMTAKVDDIFLVHGTPRNPEGWDYLLDLADAEYNFPAFEEEVCLVGHSHVPVFFKKRGEERALVSWEVELSLEDGWRYIINIGSVGQPRDRDPRAAYLIYDEAEGGLFLRRVEYDFTITQRKMAARGLPSYLYERLAVGR
jgi:predicted phosphodiesterase